VSEFDFSEIASLYKEVKKIVLLAENENNKKEVILSSVNEMRNAFDHLMRCYDEGDFEHQIDKAKGHLFRAGYDAYELLVIENTITIKELLKNYDIGTITKVFPEYFSKIYPTIEKLEKELAQARANKRVGYDFYDEKNEIDTAKIQIAFENYAKLADEVLTIKDEVIAKIDALEKVKKDNIVKDWKNFFLGILTGIISAIIWEFCC
jgi:hypothetical protein